MVLIAVAGTHAVQRLLIRCPNSLDHHICISSTGALFCGDEVRHTNYDHTGRSKPLTVSKSRLDHMHTDDTEGGFCF